MNFSNTKSSIQKEYIPTYFTNVYNYFSSGKSTSFPEERLTSLFSERPTYFIDFQNHTPYLDLNIDFANLKNCSSCLNTENELTCEIGCFIDSKNDKGYIGENHTSFTRFQIKPIDNYDSYSLDSICSIENNDFCEFYRQNKSQNNKIHLYLKDDDSSVETTPCSNFKDYNSDSCFQFLKSLSSREQISVIGNIISEILVFENKSSKQIKISSLQNQKIFNDLIDYVIKNKLQGLPEFLDWNSLISRISIEDIRNTKLLGKLFGCYLQEREYKKYNFPIDSLYLCNNSYTLQNKLLSPKNELYINKDFYELNEFYNGKFNFANYKKNLLQSGKPTTCFLDTDLTEEQLKTILSNPEFQNTCQQCKSYNPKTKTETVCPSPETIPQTTSPNSNFWSNNWKWFLIGLVIVLVLIILSVIIYIYKRKRKTKILVSKK